MAPRSEFQEAVLEALPYAAALVAAKKRARMESAGRPRISPFRMLPMYAEQQEIIDDPARMVVTEATTKAGKTMSHLELLLDRGIAAGEGNWWWVATVGNTARIAFERAKDRLRGYIQKPDGEAFRRVQVADPIPFTSRQSPAMEILCNGATFSFRSADKPDNLYGDDVRGLVGDEYTRWKEAAWSACYSLVVATRGWLRLIGNVRGRRNWGYRIARKAQNGEPGWGYHKLTAYHAAAGGIIDPTVIEQAQRDLTEAVFRELFLAEAAEDQANPFGLPSIRACVAPLSALSPTAWGWDLAKSLDWTVGIGLDRAGVTSRWDRWNKTALPAGVPPGLDYWEATERRIRELTGGLSAYIDSTGIGDRVHEAIAKGRPASKPYVFSSTSKQKLMEGLAYAIQHRSVRFPGDASGDKPSVIQSELESFEYEYTQRGVRYAAPEGLHDDCVCALALAVLALGHQVVAVSPERVAHVSEPAEQEDVWACN